MLISQINDISHTYRASKGRIFLDELHDAVGQLKNRWKRNQLSGGLEESDHGDEE